jgi:hypothetical protein
MSSKLTADETSIMFAVEEFWSRERFFPGTSEIVSMTHLPEKVVTEVMTSGRFDTRWEKLGIDTGALPLAKQRELGKNESRLTDKQIALASVLLNPLDKRSQTQKLKDLGIQPVTFNGWMKSKKFTDYMAQQSEMLFGDIMPLARDALLRKVMKGEVGAIKLYMEMRGEYGKNNDAQNDFRLLVNRLVEVIQQHVRDPKVLQAIAEEIKLLTNPPPVARGEVVHDTYPAIISQPTRSY